MTGAEHYAEAERIIGLIEDGTHGDTEMSLPDLIGLGQMHATLALAAPMVTPVTFSQMLAAGVRHCRVCGCNDDDCSTSGCVDRDPLGQPCAWVEPLNLMANLCTACVTP